MKKGIETKWHVELSNTDGYIYEEGFVVSIHNGTPYHDVEAVINVFDVLDAKYWERKYKRIVAEHNACLGITTKLLEDGIVHDAIKIFENAMGYTGVFIKDGCDEN